MRNTGNNGFKTTLGISIICVLSIVVLGVIALFFPDMLENVETAALGLALSAVLLASNIILYLRTRKEIVFYDDLIEQFGDFAFIRYDKDKRKATVSDGIERITGISVKSRTLKKQDYDALLDDIYRHANDFEEDTYSSADGSTWYRLTSYENEGIVCTTVRDVTEYMEKINIINNLRYYDSLTGLFNKQAIIDMLRRKIETGYKSIGIVHFAIVGIDKIVSFEGADTADEILEKLALPVKGYANSQSIFAGRTSNNGITVVLTQGNHEFSDYYEMVETIYASIADTITHLPENINRYLRAFCGYVIYRGSEQDASKMLAAAEFASYDALKSDSTKPVRYDSSSYKESANEFNKVRIFNEIISESLIDYHFQPIVNSRTGDIYGYEALMRPHEIEGVKLSPLEMLSIAQEQNMLEGMERTTFNMTLKILSEHQDIFHDKRLFINSVSCTTLQETEYCDLVDVYGELFPKLVIEITEAHELSEGIMPAMDKFFKPYKAHIALDDYGAGYSNDKTLLEIMPNYIKIDRSLITDINTDENKKQLVSNIISYAADHNVYSLAEGVETEEELETVIYLGVDLIQGYITCRPVPIFMHEIAPDIKSLIVKFSTMHAKRDDRVFEVNDGTPVDLVNLAVFGYTNIVVKCENASFFGDAAAKLNMRIICLDDMPVFMKFKDVNIHSDDFPVLEVGENSKFRLRLEGENTLSNQGIRIPETSSFTLDGDGNLTIDCSFLDGVCLGGNSTQSFGRIDLDTTGEVNLTNKCDRCICIGGGIGSPDSVININSGRLIIDAKGMDALGIGALDGNVMVMLNDCSITADVSGMNVVAIGSVNGSVECRSNARIALSGSGDNCCLIGTLYGKHSTIRLNTGSVSMNVSGNSLVGIGALMGKPDISSSADLSLIGAGDNCCLIGVHESRDGVIAINGGNIKLTCNAKIIAGVGSLGGNCDIALTSGIFDIMCEGSTALCVGNAVSGDISLNDVIIKAESNSGTRQNIATADGKLVITSGNIYTNSLDTIEAYSQFGSRLVCRHNETGSEPIEVMVEDGGSTYRYTSRPSPLFDGFYMYLPE